MHLFVSLAAPRRRMPITALLLAAMGSLGSTGCDKAAQLAGEAKQAVSTGVEQAKQTAGIVGSVELQLDHPVSVKSCYAHLIRLTGWPTVLNITSYQDSGAESFPSFLLRAEPQLADPAALVGARIAAEVYLQESPAGPVWHTTEAAPAQIAITSATADSLSADLEGLLVNSDTGTTRQFTGKLSGSLKIAP
jgi:hypothetical protein